MRLDRLRFSLRTLLLTPVLTGLASNFALGGGAAFYAFPHRGKNLPAIVQSRRTNFARPV